VRSKRLRFAELMSSPPSVAAELDHVLWRISGRSLPTLRFACDESPFLGPTGAQLRVEPLALRPLTRENSGVGARG
jgi:hypothetical protein